MIHPRHEAAAREQLKALRGCMVRVRVIRDVGRLYTSLKFSRRGTAIEFIPNVSSASIFRLAAKAITDVLLDSQSWEFIIDGPQSVDGDDEQLAAAILEVVTDRRRKLTQLDITSGWDNRITEGLAAIFTMETTLEVLKLRRGMLSLFDTPTVSPSRIHVHIQNILGVEEIASFASRVRLARITLNGWPFDDSHIPRMPDLRHLTVKAQPYAHIKRTADYPARLLDACPNLEILDIEPIWCQRDDPDRLLLETAIQITKMSCLKDLSIHPQGGMWESNEWIMVLGAGARMLRRLSISYDVSADEARFLIWSLPRLLEFDQQYDADEYEYAESLRVEIERRDMFLKALAASTALGDLAQELAEYL
jgi:hypothetical protein